MADSLLDFTQQQAVFSVSEFLDLTNEILQPLRVTVQGEITSITPRGRTTFFSIADASGTNAKLECLIFQYRSRQLGFQLAEGMELQLVGQPNIYKPMGKFSFVVDHASPVGEGALQQAFEALKKQLAEAGFFDPDRKQALPEYPTKIGVLTSAQGDAQQDFLTHLGQFGFQIQRFDVRVEGIQAIDSIVSAITWANQQPDPAEVLVLTRGGGSLESLQAFNSEPVAKAILASKIPVVSAVGHENDVTIADLVADVRASTPTDAGKILSQHWTQAADTVARAQTELVHRFQLQLQRQSQQVYTQTTTLLSLVTKHFQAVRYQLRQFQVSFERWQRVAQETSQTLRRHSQQLAQLFQFQLRQQRQLLTHYRQQVTAADPKRLLQQGYSIVYTSAGQVVRSVSDLTPHQELTTRLADGHVTSSITTVTPRKDDDDPIKKN